MPSWSFGLLVAAIVWIVLAPFVGMYNPWLLGACVIISAVLDSPEEGVYIE